MTATTSIPRLRLLGAVAVRVEILVALAVGVVSAFGAALLVPQFGEPVSALAQAAAKADAGRVTGWALTPQSLTTMVIVLALFLGLAAYAAVELLHNRRIRSLRRIVEAMRGGKIDPVVLKPFLSRDETGRTVAALQHILTEARDKYESLRQTFERSQHDLHACLERTTKLTESRDARLIKFESIGADLLSLSDKLQTVSTQTSSASDATSRAEQQANEVSEVVSQAMDAVANMAAEVEQGATAITQLTEHSKKITDILDVIRKVTEQTNLLSLNAAIEAARAGEHGRGFAIVADEVRKLSKQTRSAAEQIQARVETLQSSVKETASLVNHSCDLAEMTVYHAMNAQERATAITEAVATIKQINLDIAAAVAEHSRETAEIASRIGSIESAKSADEELAELARS